MPGLLGPDDYSGEPQGRYEALVISAKEPFNAETPPEDLARSFITPASSFFVRSHGPTPILDETEADFRLVVEGLAPTQLALSLSDIKALPKVSVTASLQCAGNRRTEMSLKRKVRGVGWGFGAVGNAEWAGAALADVLELAGMPKDSRSCAGGGRHVEFISVDKCPEENGGPFKASIPLAYATNSSNQVLLAYEMNGQDLTRDHGYPLRVIVPGFIGARSVKWLDKILVTAKESDGFFMQRDYKMFPPTIDWHNVDWASSRPIMDFPIQSAITQPLDKDKVKAGEQVTFQGYALAGGGRQVARVDLSVDGGATWLKATITASGGKEDGEKSWDWSLWKLKASVSPPVEVVVKAVDESSNTQPETSEVIWNIRGVLNNSWHRIQLLPL